MVAKVVIKWARLMVEIMSVDWSKLQLSCASSKFVQRAACRGQLCGVPDHGMVGAIGLMNRLPVVCTVAVAFQGCMVWEECCG